MARVIVITGTSKGIGLELAKYYLQKGHMVVGCARSQNDIKDKNYRHFVLDVSDERAVVDMIREIKTEFNKIDILINLVNGTGRS